MVCASTAKLFSPLTLGGTKNPMQLLHHIVMVPLTRLRSGEEGIPPTFAVAYYAQRTIDGEVLIAEGTSAVHGKGRNIFVQHWHAGYVRDPLNHPGEALSVSSSTASMDDVESFAVTREGRKTYVAPRLLETREIAGVVEVYRKAAVDAIKTGFDGVELYLANGYLLEQCLCDSVNKRTDRCGGTVENRARFFFEALDASMSSVESSKVGVQVSSFGVTFDYTDSSPAETYSYVIAKLNAYDLAYLHVIEPRGNHFKSPLVLEIGVTATSRPLYKGVYLTVLGYDRESALQVASLQVRPVLWRNPRVGG